MPIVHHHILALRTALYSHRSYKKSQQRTARIALVPTMGNLHQGHLELVKLAKQHADIVVVSIFVNPTQFGVGEDFDSYPRTLDEDVAKLKTVGADYVFAPTIDEMYPVLPVATSIRAGAITEQLCGRTRPTHFDGVGIIVAKLFNIVQPDIAVFGQKDYQQLAIIKQLVADLSYPIDIISAPIFRADDGLALSSRNQYLSAVERKIAPILHQELQRLAQQLIDNKESISSELLQLELVGAKLESLLAESHARISAKGFVVDYLELKTSQLQAVNSKALAALSDRYSLVILVAAKLGRTRLLDNQLIKLNG